MGFFSGIGNAIKAVGGGATKAIGGAVKGVAGGIGKLPGMLGGGGARPAITAPPTPMAPAAVSTPLQDLSARTSAQGMSTPPAMGGTGRAMAQRAFSARRRI